MSRSSLMLVLLCLGACADSSDTGDIYGPVVTRLIEVLEARPPLEVSLVAAIDSAALPGLESLPDFFAHVDELVTWIPVEREIIPKVLSLHYVVNQAPGDALNRDEEFNQWLSSVAEAWGAFLDTPESARGIESFASMPDYNVDDFSPGPSGWQTFNQFFAREIKPGKRPVESPSNDSVIVSPADAIFMGAWPINEDATVTVKGADWSISQLLDGSPYADRFSSGVYAHAFLRITDYHRYHVPVSGIVREVRNVHGRVYIDVARNEDGSLSGVNGDTYQFTQERGLVVLESPTVGLVALVPVGMTLISSVTLEPDVGAELGKGEEFGYFQFGGSDIVMLFQNPNILLEADVGTRYLQGQRIGRLERQD